MVKIRAIIVALLTITVAHADIEGVSINFYQSVPDVGVYGRLDGAQDGVADESPNTSSFGATGYVASNWNNFTNPNGSDLFAEDGSLTTLSISANRPNLNSRVNTTADQAYNNTAMRAFLRANLVDADNDLASVTLGNISANFSGTVNAIVYTHGHSQNNGWTAYFTEGGASDLDISTDASYSGKTRWGAATYENPPTQTTTVLADPESAATSAFPVSQYAVFSFDADTVDTVTLSLKANHNQFAGLGGVQFVGTVIPEPATAGLLCMGASGLLFLRKKFNI
jgi:hypothetical protein